MGIPYWREVQCLDDGWVKFQCLNCKQTWEGGAPWYEFEDTPRGEKLKKDWSFCPMCRCEWKGKKITKEKCYFSIDNTKPLYINDYKIMKQYTAYNEDGSIQYKTDPEDHYSYNKTNYQYALILLKDYIKDEEKYNFDDIHDNGIRASKTIYWIEKKK